MTAYGAVIFPCGPYGAAFAALPAARAAGHLGWNSPWEELHNRSGTECITTTVESSESRVLHHCISDGVGPRLRSVFAAAGRDAVAGMRTVLAP